MNNSRLVQDGIDMLARVKILDTTAVSPSVILQRYDNGQSKLAAYLLTEPLPPQTADHADLLQLVQKLEDTFNQSDLQDLCFRLQVNPEDLEGTSRTDKIRELVKYMQRYGRLSQLRATCAQLRPATVWGQNNTQTIINKVDTAVVIDIARPVLANVAKYLDNKGIAANFLLFRHIEPGQFFSVHDNWQQLANTFATTMDRLKNDFTASRLHFFLAGPGTLLFAMGCIWGTVDQALVYHYEQDNYYPVLPISRELRQINKG